MKAAVAGIFSSARLRFAIFVSRLLLQVGRSPVHAASRRGLELFPLAASCRDSVLDRLADRMLGIGDHRPGPRCGFTRSLRRLASAELDGLGPKLLDLFA